MLTSHVESCRTGPKVAKSHFFRRILFVNTEFGSLRSTNREESDPDQSEIDALLKNSNANQVTG